ncbi:hypothetical protein ACIP29_11445 [Streptomyces coelicoflavus]|uniref:hypothetical protein n=1 Tax=Streptomyces coelicoflavus TaxID=285562 RepID=UPI0002475C42|nr:hypothetical protein SMCF_5062 [Streptomyces coelicoflavus ZG0656]MZE43877.1 hypothetical protein [Streptomyces sp. SID5477]
MLAEVMGAAAAGALVLTAADLGGDRWVLNGCALSDLSVRCSGSVPVHLLGHQGNHAPTVSGNVVDLLADLGR